MIEHLPIDFAGTRMHLLADRALYWPERRLLVIADLHLGKGDIFRAHGIAVPSGGTAHDLARLDRLLHATTAEGLLILGDVLHGGQVQARWREDWAAFRQRWPRLAMMAVTGNHDRSLATVPLGLQLLDQVWMQEGINFCHDVEDAAAPVIGGHLHPVLRIPGETRRVPVFWICRQRMVLPAFSAFTGGYRVSPGRDDRFYACNGTQIVGL